VPTASTAGPTPGANAGVLAGAGLVVTGQSNGIVGANAPPAGWAFDEYLKPGGGGYFVDWNDQGNGVLPGAAAFAVNNNPGSIAFNGASFGVFNAFSPFGPVPGFGVVDPPYSGPLFAIEFTDSTGVTGPQLQELEQGSAQVGPAGLCSEYSGPCTDPSGNLLASPVPEPASGGVLAMALLGLAAAARWRRHG
jgi:MYXO-CTERM domain-containing protein